MPTENHSPPMFFAFVDFIRGQIGDIETVIMPMTRFEDDLGVTGDDGIDLLEAVEKRYGISLEPIRETFGLQADDYLFRSEGVGLGLFGLLYSQPIRIHPFRVGELYEAVCQKISEK